MSLARIEATLNQALSQDDGPPLLAQAMRHAVFPGGARIRPRLCIAVAQACGDIDPASADAAAASIELLHCASLVHDDLPCFDDAGIRRGRLSVHRAFGEPLAVLAGDGLIVLAFEVLVAAGPRVGALVRIVARAAGTPDGIVAGQAWESEARIDLSRYQQAKTGALFAAATAAGAVASGADGRPWRALGEWLGEAFQVADDLKDVCADPATLGKPVGQDAAHGRPNAALTLGVAGALDHFRALAAAAADSIPACPGRDALHAHILAETGRLVPAELA